MWENSFLGNLNMETDCSNVRVPVDFPNLRKGHISFRFETCLYDFESSLIQDSLSKHKLTYN